MIVNKLLILLVDLITNPNSLISSQVAYNDLRNTMVLDFKESCNIILTNIMKMGFN